MIIGLGTQMTSEVLHPFRHMETFWILRMRDSYHIGFSICYYIDKKRVEFKNIIVKILIPWRKIKLGKPDDGTIEDLSDIIEFHCDEPSN